MEEHKREGFWEFGAEGMSGPVREVVSLGWLKLHSEELLHNIIRFVRFWACDGWCM
jgi:hypothetical protein